MQSLRLDWDADTALPFDLGMVKDQLRILDDQFDPLINDIHFPAAVQWAEGVMHRSILAKTHRWIISDFPRTVDQGIRLPRGKTQSVSSIQYVSNNVTTTLTGPTSGSPAGTDYREDLRGNDGGVIYPAYSETWPSVDIDTPTPVLITFSAGWTAAQIPGDIKNALMMYISDALDITGAADAKGLDLDAKSRLLTSWRIIRSC